MTHNHKMPNRLLQEKSPYLLQHAHNPVDWYPWGGEAFARAVAEDKPIFLSIGYSTCHWCHVMERESFEDEEVARALNADFIAIKVDREERPDIDHIYMNVCQAFTGSGGWPLTIIMTPDRKPFFAGTYFPKRSRMGYPGLMEILEKTMESWESQKQELLQASEDIMRHIREESEVHYGGVLGLETAGKAFTGFKASFDKEYGGFGRAPKFPMPHNLQFLLRYWKLTKDQDAMDMVEKTLVSMYRGGIYDHVGYGFSRYSTDRKWLVPHFEKMLYDNAGLAVAYLEAYQATEKRQYGEVARQIFEYVLRDMTSPEGGFYSAEDADSEGVEGKFYLWSPKEATEILGEEAAVEFNGYYGINEKGNFEEKSIPNLLHNKEAFDNITANPIVDYRRKMHEARETRVHPYKDDKILTAWNGLMIAALAFGSRVLDDKRYLEAAENALGFIRSKLIREDGRLLARYREGEAAYPGYLEDYAFTVLGLIELYEASFRPDYLRLALDLNRDMLRYFRDEENGGLYLYGSDSEELITRPKDVYDGAIPSGNSVAAMNLFRLSRLTGDSELEDMAYEQLNAFAAVIEGYPMGHTHMLMALLFAGSKAGEIVIVGDRNEKSTQRMLEAANKRFLPFTTVVLKDAEALQEGVAAIVPYTEGQIMMADRTTAYICENFSCRAPVTDISEFEGIMSGI
ncbi:MAG TPA: thioredoxin domain-containing protein [Negativicutes bacterium]|nr:thioredoxin domain-containing protein [Negativicutes bacterium]